MSTSTVTQAECWRCDRCGRVSARREDNTFQLQHSEYSGEYTGSTLTILTDSIKGWTTEHCLYSRETPPCPWVRMLAVPA